MPWLCTCVMGGQWCPASNAASRRGLDSGGRGAASTLTGATRQQHIWREATFLALKCPHPSPVHPARRFAPRSLSQHHANKDPLLPPPRWPLASAMSVKVYIGNLPGDVREAELEDMFYRYRPGRIDIKRPPRGPAFAFVEFRDIRDAEGACRPWNPEC